MSILYKPVRSKLRKAFKNYCSYYDDDNPIWTKETMNIDTKRMYTSKEISTLYKLHEWMQYEADEDECFETCCGWCYEPRWDCPAHDNEHDECDLRLHYTSEIGVMEQEKTLVDLKPTMPSVIVDKIIQFLIPR